MSNLFKDIIPSIMMTGKDCLINEKDYVPFVVNKALSFHVDCVLQSNSMNQYPNTDPKLQYYYYLHGLRKYKRPYKEWMKREEIPDLEIIKEYYGYSNDKAKETLKILSQDSIKELRQKLFKGGTKGR